tara:strand:+ start:1566 stop:1709 length:144 start_codon:yes stop_codon:yes gene_type:complete
MRSNLWLPYLSWGIAGARVKEFCCNNDIIVEADGENGKDVDPDLDEY